MGLAKRGRAGPLCPSQAPLCDTHSSEHVPAASLKEIKSTSMAPALLWLGWGWPAWQLAGTTASVASCVFFSLSLRALTAQGGLGGCPYLGAQLGTSLKSWRHPGDELAWRGFLSLCSS